MGVRIGGRAALAAAGLATALALAGCGWSDDSASSAASASPAPSSSSASASKSASASMHAAGPVTPGWTSPASPTLDPAFESDDQPGYVNTIDVAPDGSTLATGDSEGNVKLWRADGTPVATLSGHRGEVDDVAFSPDGQTLASAGEDGTLRLWSLATRQATVVQASTDDELRRVVWSPDGSGLVTGGWDATALRVHGTDGAVVATLATAGSVEAVQLSGDGLTLAVGGANGYLELWRRTDPTSTAWAKAFSAEGDGASLEHLAFSPDGGTVYGASNDSTVKVWHTADGAAQPDLGSYRNYVNGVALSPDGALLAAGALSGELGLTSTATGSSLVDTETYGGVNDLAFFPDRPLLAVAEGQRFTVLRLA